MLIFIDMETTGLNVEDKICSIALIAVDDENYSYIYEVVNEGKKIAPKASSIHHITNEMLEGKTSFTQSKAYAFLQNNNSPNNILVGHNIAFSLAFLQPYGYFFEGKLIDTLRATKHLIPECELFSLQILRYELKLYRQAKALTSRLEIQTALNEHKALSDSVVVVLLYHYLLEIVTPTEMVELSAKNVLLQKLPFGKYAGRYIEDVVVSDGAYLHWILNSMSDLDEDLRYSISYYLEA